MGKIGFTANRDKENDAEKKEDKSKKSASLALKNVLQLKYASSGDSEKKVYKSTADLLYEIETIICIGESILIEVMLQEGYKIEYIDDRPYWVMYEK